MDLKEKPSQGRDDFAACICTLWGACRPITRLVYEYFGPMISLCMDHFREAMMEL